MASQEMLYNVSLNYANRYKSHEMSVLLIFYNFMREMIILVMINLLVRLNTYILNKVK